RHASAHAAVPQRGWWEGIVGEGLAVDTQRFQVLAFDWLGGNGASTAPGPGEAFPFVAAADQAAALWRLCDALGIANVYALVGSSYGGMVALHAAAQSPDRVGRLGVLAAAHRSHPQASAWRAVQRGIVELGLRTGEPAAALALARGLAMTTYRTPGELGERFAGPGTVAGCDVRFPVQDWLDARGATFAANWTAEQFLCLNRSIDAHQIDPRAVRVPASLLAFAGDQLVPPADVRELALALPDLRLHRELRSRYGHDAFLKEVPLVAAFVREVLR
ncbi:MAG: homoserine O-succinyltransferase, partial [Planctomycetota bacterium]